MTFAEVERIQVVKCRVRGYKREFERFFGCVLPHKYTWYASGCVTEYVRGTCVQCGLESDIYLSLKDFGTS